MESRGNETGREEKVTEGCYFTIVTVVVRCVILPGSFRITHVKDATLRCLFIH